jgi:hypothetical protein
MLYIACLPLSKEVFIFKTTVKMKMHTRGRANGNPEMGTRNFETRKQDRDSRRFTTSRIEIHDYETLLVERFFD